MDYIEQLDIYHIPRRCASCGGVMIYKGVGEYHCEDCDAVAYDDYGKVRMYIEAHNGATAAMIERDTGVSQKTIRQMLREQRIEIAADSRAFLHCDICQKAIRSGKLCPECEAKVHRSLEGQVRNQKEKSVQGFGMQQHPQGESGSKRFVRDTDRP